MSEVATLDAEINRTELTLASGRVEKVVEEFIASHTTLVLTLEAEVSHTFLKQWIPVNTDLSISGADKVQAILTQSDMEAGSVESLEFNKGIIGYSKQVGLLISGHCDQLLAEMSKPDIFMGE